MFIRFLILASIKLNIKGQPCLWVSGEMWTLFVCEQGGCKHALGAWGMGGPFFMGACGWVGLEKGIFWVGESG